MPLIVPDSYAMKMLNLIVFAASNAGGIKQNKIKLYQNDVTPSRSSVFSDFTEASFTGYTAGVMDEGGWTLAAMVSGTPQVTYDNSPGFTFTCSSGSGQLQYGYFVVADGGEFDGALLFAERFDTPRLIAPGVPLVLLSNFTLKSQYPET